MFELLVPAEKAQLEKVGGDKKRYDKELRPELMVQAIHQLQDAGVEADVWKIEGIDSKEDAAKVVEAAHRGGRDHVGSIILGRGEDDKKVREWLTIAAAVPGFIGFAVGRTTFWEPLTEWKEGPQVPRGRRHRDRPQLPRVGQHLRVGRRQEGLIAVPGVARPHEWRRAAPGAIALVLVPATSESGGPRCS